MAENFDLIFGQNASQQYAWSDSDYQDGWETVGNIPPTTAQFDALQRRNDMKTKELNDNLIPLVNANTAETRQPATAYNEGDMKYSPLLPTGWFLSCAVAGTTSAGEIVLPSPVVENASVVDGTVTWKIRKIGSGGGEAVGVIKAFAGNGDIPSGYLLCDGAAVSRTMFPDLFAAIGTTYGAGDGSTTFNVPDYNTAARFAQGGTVAGTVKEPGLPNITGSVGTEVFTITSNSGALYRSNMKSGVFPSGSNGWSGTLNINASNSSPIYGNSDTVQPPALTMRYIIKAFDGQTADSALIDITQYAQELAGKANITGSNLVHHRDVITTSGTYTAPVTGLYKITVKGGGGGGTIGGYQNSVSFSGAGGGEGGTTVVYAVLLANDTVSVVVGAGGAPSTAGGDSSVVIDNDSYVGGGGRAGLSGTGEPGKGGTGTFIGASGSPGVFVNGTMYFPGGTGGGTGGGVGKRSDAGTAGTNGGGGAGGNSYNNYSGTAGGDGYVWFEYYTPGA